MLRNRNKNGHKLHELLLARPSLLQPADASKAVARSRASRFGTLNRRCFARPFRESEGDDGRLTQLFAERM